MSDKITAPEIEAGLQEIKTIAKTRSVAPDLVLEERIAANLAEIEKVTIETDEQETFLLNWRRRNKISQEIVKALHEPERSALDKAHRAVTATIKRKIDFLEAGFRRASALLITYHQKKEADAKKVRDEADAAAKKAAEDQKIEEAIEADDETILDEPVLPVPLPPPVPIAPKGVTYPETWEPEVFNLKDLAAAVAAGEVPVDMIQANMVQLRKFGAATKGAIRVRSPVHEEGHEGWAEMTTTFDAKLHEYRVDGIVRPGPSKVLAAVGLSDASHYTEGSAERGRARHEAIFLCQKGLVSASSFGDEIRPYLEAWSKFGRETGFHVDTQEEIRTHPGGAYCGTPDLTGWMTTGTATAHGVVDIKTGGLEVWHGVQLAAYRELTGLRLGWILQLKADGSYRLLDEGKDFDGVVRKFSNPYWARVWNAALTIYQCKGAA